MVLEKIKFKNGDEGYVCELTEKIKEILDYDGVYLRLATHVNKINSFITDNKIEVVYNDIVIASFYLSIVNDTYYKLTGVKTSSGVKSNLSRFITSYNNVVIEFKCEKTMTLYSIGYGNYVSYITDKILDEYGVKLYIGVRDNEFYIIDTISEIYFKDKKIPYSFLAIEINTKDNIITSFTNSQISKRCRELMSEGMRQANDIDYALEKLLIEKLQDYIGYQLVIDNNYNQVIFNINKH